MMAAERPEMSTAGGGSSAPWEVAQPSVGHSVAGATTEVGGASSPPPEEHTVTKMTMKTSAPPAPMTHQCRFDRRRRRCQCSGGRIAPTIAGEARYRLGA